MKLTTPLLCISLLAALGLGCQRPPSSEAANDAKTEPNPATAQAEPGPEEEVMRNPLETLSQSDRFVSNASTQSLLEARDHNPSFPLHRALIRIMSEREIARTSLHLGFHWREQRVELNWFCSDTGIVGQVDEVEEYLDALSMELGFEQASHDAKFLPILWVREDSHFLEQFRREAAVRWVGGKRATTGNTLLFVLQAQTQTLPPSLAEVLEYFPFLRDERIDEKLFQTLAQWPTVELSRGGTRSKYDSTSLAFAERSASDHKALATLLGELGFEEDGQRRDYVSYRRGGSYAQLYNLGEDGVLALHWQPES
ncbi:MAG: hypothetical protein RBU37_10960 [Myxococcota bacterium]|jgi:hypothetical protein|nr:hypothetical protein [Myxococcota bacterium]